VFRLNDVLRGAAVAVSGVGIAAALLTPAGAAPAAPDGGGTQIVVKVDLGDGYTIDDIAGAFPVAVDSGGLASRGIYLVHPTDPRYLGDPKKAADLAKKIADADGVVYAESDLPVRLADTQFHGWPYGTLTAGGTDPDAWSEQPAVTDLRLADAHARSRGAGTVVAVLDTGADTDHPALAGRLLAGWNYVDDNADTGDVPTGTDRDGDGLSDSAVGHGTFVSGLIGLVAPDARILPYRVLDSDGYGTSYEVAQAIVDATAAGADVINLSFGTAAKTDSHLLHDAITQAQRAGVVLVGAAGNDASNRPHYPAAHHGVLGVSALAADGRGLTSFSAWGSWAALAAPGQQVTGPVPGGGYAAWSGTSMAAPFVSGQAALLRAAVPGMRLDKLTEAISHTVTTLPDHPVRFGAINIPASLDFARSHH
jgi:subtilisin family serine protease